VSFSRPSSNLADFVANNLFVLIAALLVFTMTGSVGLLEIGELGDSYSNTSLLKVMLITGIGFLIMAIVGFNTAFAPTIGGIIGTPTYSPGFFLSGASNVTGVFWSMTGSFFGTGLSLGTYFFFETAFATVTLALVGVVVLKKVKLEAFALFSVVYFLIIWNLPAAWIWNPTGWLYLLGMRDFAGGLVVHGAAGAAGLAILVQLWSEEKKSGLKESVQVPINVSPSWLTLAIVLLWVGWFGFNPGSVLAFDSSAISVVLTTFLCAAASFLSLMLTVYWRTRQNPGLIMMGNGVLMGLIVITPVAGFVSPASAILLGIISGPLFYSAEVYVSKIKWFSDPIGLVPGHLTGGLFGVLMIGFFSQSVYTAASGNPTVPDGIFFGGGTAALHQLGIEVFGIIVVLAFVFAVSFVTIKIASAAFHGILVQPKIKANLEEEKARS
jgi:ammonium transporter, Amt family